MRVMSKFTFVALAFMLLLLGSCKNAEKMVESGNYDAAIDYCVRKLAGKKKKPELVNALELAFEKANSRDMRAIKQIQARDRKEEFYKIIDLAKNIDRRQRMVEPLLPLYDDNGYKSDFSFVKTSVLIEDSQKKSAAFWYDQGKKLLAKARSTGDKQTARDAYAAFDKVGEFIRNYKETADYKEQARQRGIVYYLLGINPNSGVVMPTQMRNDLLDINLSDLNSLFRIYHKKPMEGVTYDAEVILNVENVVFSPESINTREFEEEREVKDGQQYVLDENGNVAKDSLGNDIKEDRFVVVKALLLESKQFKSAVIEASAEFYNLHTKQKMQSVLVGSESNFIHFSTRMLAGDKRALTRETRRRLGVGPLPFPTNEQLLMNSAADIRNNLLRAIRENRSLL